MPSDAADALAIALGELMLPRRRYQLCAPVIAAAPADLDMQSYFLLTVLHRHEPLTVAGAATELGIDRSGTSRYADRLAAAGLVERRAGTHDRRSNELSLTAAGRRLARRLHTVLARHLEDITAGWDPDEVAGLATAVARLITDADPERTGDRATDP